MSDIIIDDQILEDDERLDFLLAVGSHERLQLVRRHQKELKDQGLLEAAFIAAYTSVNTKMCRIDYDLVRAIIADCSPGRMLEAGPLPEVRDTYTLYRGAHQDALAGFSWTGSLKVAQQFAERCKGVVVTARVRHDEILFFSDDRKEQEYFLRPEAVERVAGRAKDINEVERNKKDVQRAIEFFAEQKKTAEEARQAPEKPLLTPSGTAPRPAGKFAALVKEMEIEKIRFLLDGCPEIEIPSIVRDVDLEEMEAQEMIQGLPADIRYIVEATAKIQNIDPVFSLSGFFQAATVCTGLRAGVIVSADDEHRESGTAHIVSIGNSSDGKGRGVSRYAEVIDAGAKKIDAAYNKAREMWLTATAGDLPPVREDGEKAEKKDKGRKILRLPHIRAYTTNPTEGKIVDIHIDNPQAGTALWVDEAGNALQELTKFTKGGGEESAKNLLINGFDARRPYIRDRMRRPDDEGYMCIERFGMSFLGGLQTQYAAKFFSGNDGKSRGRGMAQRFLSFTGAEIPASREEITIESLYKKKDKSDAIEVRQCLDQKYAAMLDLDRVEEFYSLAHDLIQEGKGTHELNEMIKAGLCTDTIFFTLQPKALLELEQFKQRLDQYRQECNYSQDEKSSISYDKMKVDKIIAILHYYKWSDLPVRQRHPSYYIAHGMHQGADIPREYRNIELKYGDIRKIPVTMDTVQSAIKIVLFSAHCRRNLFDESEDTSMTEKVADFIAWAQSLEGRRIYERPLMAKEIVELKIPVFKDGQGKAWGQGKIKEFLKKHLKLENRKERRGYVFDFKDMLKPTMQISMPTGPAVPPVEGCAVVQLGGKSNCTV